MDQALRQAGIRFRKHPAVFGRPDFALPVEKIAIFCDSHFWHGYKWKAKQKEIHSNRSFWVPKILSNMQRDRTVNRRLRREGWIVLRFWEHQITRFTRECMEKVQQALAARKSQS